MGEHLPCKQGVKSSNLSISTGREAGRLEDMTGERIKSVSQDTYLENRILNENKYQDIRGTSKDVKLKNNLEPRVQRYAPEEMEQPVRSPSGYLKACGFSITFASQMSVPFGNSP